MYCHSVIIRPELKRVKVETSGTKEKLTNGIEEKLTNGTEEKLLDGTKS